MLNLCACKCLRVYFSTKGTKHHYMTVVIDMFHAGPWPKPPPPSRGAVMNEPRHYETDTDG